MYVSFMAPHDPRTMPQEFLNLYRPESILLPPNYLPEHPFDNGELRVRDELLASWPRTPREVRRHIAEYYGMISHLDAEMGRVLDMLKAVGEADNTIILFSGDNGLALGQHGLMGKQSCYDHSVHVPLVIRGPGIPEGGRRREFCQLQDLFPTVCDLAGLPIPDSVEGRSLAPTITRAEGSGQDHLLFAYRNVQRAVLQERLKLIEYRVNGRRTSQLFDLAEDPWETTNLIGRPGYEEQAQRLRRLLSRWRDELGDPAPEFWEGF
jgi:arylsulfatase A-like enzyme